MNVVLLIGRLTRDPELRYTQSGKAVANFNLAVDREHSKEKVTDFFRVIVWNKQAENLSKYSGKGRLVAVRGNLQTRSYEDKQQITRQITEVIAERIQYLDWGNKDGNQNQGNNMSVDDEYHGFMVVDDEDVPF
jgi:single-strand DNA-binding protein